MKEIPLTKGFVTIVDDCDYEELSQYKWHVVLMHSSPKAVRKTPGDENGKQHAIYMHRQIMNAPPGMDVDHINHDTLDNRRSTNLRVCTRAQNAANQRKGTGCSSQFKGVSWEKDRGKWRAQITISGKSTYLGLFDDEVDAACAYNAEARVKFREFALLNDV